MRHFKVICVSLFEADISEFSMTLNMISLSLKLLLKGRLHIVVYEWIALKFAKLLGVCKAPRGTCMFTPPVLISSQPLGVIIWFRLEWSINSGWNTWGWTWACGLIHLSRWCGDWQQQDGKNKACVLWELWVRCSTVWDRAIVYSLWEGWPSWHENRQSFIFGLGFPQALLSFALVVVYYTLLSLVTWIVFQPVLIPTSSCWVGLIN